MSRVKRKLGSMQQTFVLGIFSTCDLLKIVASKRISKPIVFHNGVMDLWRVEYY
mgnify:CR=1 FL=1